MANQYSVLIKLFRKGVSSIDNLFFKLKDILSERHFIYLSCVAVSISCSLAVILLKSFAHSVFLIANYINAFLKLPYINSILPIIGILLTIFVIKHFLGGEIEKGSSRILYAIARKGGVMPRKQMYAQIITSSLTVGLGGSAGLESPITITGAAFGSNFAQKFKLLQKHRILLLACGVASGIGAAFNAPIAGVLFAIEIVLTDVSISAFIPIIISAATGALVSTILLNEDVLLSFNQKQIFDYKNIPSYILLGILAGFASVYHARNFRKIEHFFSQFKNQTYKRGLAGALLLATLIFFFPTFFGEGSESIKILTSDNPNIILENTLLEKFKSNEFVLILFVGASMFLKVFATGLTLGSGGNGGNFAPSLFVGSYLGFIVAKSINLLGFSHQLPIGNFTIVGMAGILSGLFHAPLTAIFLIGEITGGYNLMVPLMIVSSISFAVSKRFEKYSMDVKSLALKGDVFTDNKDKNITSNINILNLIDNNIQHLNLNNSIQDIIDLLGSTNQTFFPVLNNKQELVGVIYLENIKHYIFNPFKIKHTNITDVISNVEITISYNDNAEITLKKFEKAKMSNLPVIKENKYFGYINKLDILEAYRKKLNEMVIE